VGVLDAVIDRDLNDRVAGLDYLRCRLRGFRRRVGALGLPVDLEQIAAALVCAVKALRRRLCQTRPLLAS
jgi:hypothetical protein